MFVRQSAEKIRYDLVDGGWCVDEPEEAAEKLKQYLNMLLEKEKLLVKEANISYIYDEHQPVSVCVTLFKSRSPCSIVLVSDIHSDWWVLQGGCLSQSLTR